MKSKIEVIEQVDKENQTQEGGAKKGTSNAKNYTSRCTGMGLNKIFAALPEEEKGDLRTMCFTPLLLIDPIATMLTLVVEIFNRHISDMKFQFWGTIIQIKPIHVCLILGIRVSPIANEFLFVDPDHMTNFRMRQFPKKKNTYGLKEIDDILKHAKLERHHDDVLRLNLLKIILSFLLPNKGRNVGRNHIEGPAIGVAPTIESHAVGVPVIDSSSTTTKNGGVVVRVCSQLEEYGKMFLKLDDHENLLQQVASGKRLEVVKYLVVDDDIEVRIEINLEAILSEYGGGLLEKGDKKNDEDEKDVKEKVKSVKEEQPQVAKEVEVQEMEESKNGDEKVDDVEKDGEENESEEEQPQTMVAAEVAKTDIVFFNREKVIGEAYQTKENKEEVEQSKEEEDIDEASQSTYLNTKESKDEVEQIKEEVAKGKDDDDGNSQKWFNTHSHDEKNQVDQVWSLRKDELSLEAKKDNRSTYRRIGEETVCLNALYTLYPKQWLDKEVINVCIKALIQYFDTQHHAHLDKEKIFLANVFACQYISRDFNISTRNMSSPEGKKICIYDSMVDAKIVNAQKKKLSPGHQLIEDQLSKILLKMLIWTNFADRSSSHTGSEVKNYGLNFKWTTSFRKCLIQPNGYEYGVNMPVLMNNILRGIKFQDLIDGDECRYTIT
ncbi:hypothetical protein GIB67_000472 [Kingdonia uniflora]|uniref:Uncharacterized protein n=1 Tax=Kingdonia uniflora TaxID=39325 RepID=A0A7J7L0F5_9MAGN|nr:hypothetical protein GIB67_000472 [Kingdonia uniflora]